jgi:probable HAF family extracellular repeat protein
LNFTTFTAPGATDTIGHTINNRGQIVGDYHDAAGVRHGFLLQNGQYTTIDPPNSVFTFAEGINDAGVIVGLYYTPDGPEHGFVYKGGHYSAIDFPGSLFTQAGGINSAGLIVGDYFDSNGFDHGFILNGGHFQSVDAPSAVNTFLFFVNDFGLMTGDTYGTDSSTPELGFLRLGGQYRFTQYPGSRDSANFGLNNLGTFGGVFDDDNGYNDGFVNLFGYYYDIYGAAYGINDRNQVVGYTVDATGALVGFTAQLPLQPTGP